MDEILVPNLTRSEDISAFGERDARQVGAAAERIQRPGDFVIIESQNRSLRDHYVKQILSLVFASHSGLVVRRCKKERDWMIATINNALAKKKSSSDMKDSSSLTEVWVVDLHSSEDFDLVKLAQTLVAQFAEGGVCMIVSCSVAITDHPLFTRWAARLAIPVWSFELPDSEAMKTFLDQEADAGAVNQARLLVNELESVVLKLPVVTKEESSLSEHYSNRGLSQIVNPVAHLKAESVVSITGKEALAPLQGDKPLNEKRENAVRSKLAEVKPEIARNTMPIAKIVFFAGMILLLSLGTVSVLINDSAIRWAEQKFLEIEFPSWKMLLEPSVKRVLIELSEITSEGEGLKIDDRLPKNDKNSGLTGGKVYDEGAAIIKNELQELVELSGQKQEVLRTSRALPFFQRPDLAVNKDGIRNGSNSFLNTRGVEPSVKVLSEVVDRELRPVEYFAQLAAFSSKSSAQGWRLSRSIVLPKTLVVEKNGGLWAVVSGPFSSEQAAKSAFLQKRIKVYVVKSNDLKLGLNGGE